MTTKTARKNRSRLQRDFIPNFEMRSVLVIATFAVSAASIYAQTSVKPPGVAGQNNAMAMSVAADRPESAAMANPIRTSSNNIEAAFNRADGDRDGRLSRKEAEHFPMLSQRFDAIDTNRDSFISREEFVHAAGN